MKPENMMCHCGHTRNEHGDENKTTACLQIGRPGEYDCNCTKFKLAYKRKTAPTKRPATSKYVKRVKDPRNRTQVALFSLHQQDGYGKDKPIDFYIWGDGDVSIATERDEYAAARLVTTMKALRALVDQMEKVQKKLTPR